jgi:hypothetical protein
VIARRLNVFKLYKVPYPEEIAHAQMGALLGRQLLARDSMLIMIYQGQIMLGRGKDTNVEYTFCNVENSSVVTMYNSTGGKGARHAWTASSANIGALSYLSVQTYTCSWRTRFETVYGATRLVGSTYNFAHISSDAVLYVLPADGWTASTTNPQAQVNVTAHTLDIFSVLQRATGVILAAHTELRRRRRKEK